VKTLIHAQSVNISDHVSEMQTYYYGSSDVDK